MGPGAPGISPDPGLYPRQTPCVATLHLVFRRLDKGAFEAALKDWAQTTLGDRREAIAIDGKSLRGIHGEELPGVHLVAAYAQGAGLVLAQGGVESKEAELTVAPALLAQLELKGHLVTGDALYAQRALSRQVVDQGGEYFWVVKANQPSLQEAIARLFAQPPWGGLPGG